ncbi:cullin-1-like [Haemaphysalis longicornis]
MASDSGPVNECAVESGKRSDRDDIWADLLEGMKQAYTCSRAGMSRSRYMQLYDCVRQYMSGPPWSSVPLFQRIRRPRDNLDKSLFVELYSRIAAFLESHLQSLSSDGTFLVGEDFLRFYVRAWEEYKISSRVLDGICSFINRTWVKRMRAINNKACENLVNNNAVTKRVNSSEKSSELLVQYCCGLLNKAYDNQNTSDIQDDLDKVIVLFKYIKDKDTFEKLYSKMLADRLVNQTSISHEVEISMISRFKQSCGINYTSKLERMLQDVRLSRDLNGEFTKQVTGGSVSIGFQFIPMVLTAGWWPFEEPSATCSLPQELCQSVQWFTAFYFCKHNARKLTWLHSICRGELTTSCFKNSHIIQASMFQMVVLLEFNIALSFSIQQLHESTDIRMDTLIEVVKTLLKNRLLVTPENGREDPSSLATCQPGTIVSLNDNYSNKKVHVNISVPVRASEEAEQAASRKAVELDRKLGIQAAIVRIMKARKTLEHRELVAEVLRQLSSLFTPDVLAIKAGIDKMIEREYIERAEGQSDVYKYVA